MLAALAAILGISEAALLAEATRIIVSIVHDVVTDVLTRRAVDPVYAANLDTAIAARDTAKTPEDLLAVQIRIRTLMAGAQ